MARWILGFVYWTMKRKKSALGRACLSVFELCFDKLLGHTSAAATMTLASVQFCDVRRVRTKPPTLAFTHLHHTATMAQEHTGRSIVYAGEPVGVPKAGDTTGPSQLRLTPSDPNDLHPRKPQVTTSQGIPGRSGDSIGGRKVSGCQHSHRLHCCVVLILRMCVLPQASAGRRMWSTQTSRGGHAALRLAAECTLCTSSVPVTMHTHSA